MEITGSIPRAARILDVLAETPDGLNLAEIVSRTGFSKTTAFRVFGSSTPGALCGAGSGGA